MSIIRFAREAGVSCRTDPANEKKTARGTWEKKPRAFGWLDESTGRRWWSWLAYMPLLLLGSGLPTPGAFGANPAQEEHTFLRIDGTQFTLNNRPTFLLGFSYYGALGAPEDFIRQDLTELRALGFNWLRVWATWGGYDTNVSAVTAAGQPREPYLTRLKWLIAECDRLGMVVDVTLNRGSELSGFQAHLAAVETLVTTLKPFRNWYLDLGNERDVRDARHVSLAELKELRAKVRGLDPQRLVTASFGGHDLSLADVRGALEEAGVDFLCPHRPRDRESPGETETQTRSTVRFMKEAGRIVPVHYQEPFRRGYTTWEPVATDFLTDLRGALNGGAAGWCFHNGGQRMKPDEQPRRSFDLRAKRLMDQLDEEEMKVVRSVKSVLLEHRKKDAGAGQTEGANTSPARPAATKLFQVELARQWMVAGRRRFQAAVDALKRQQLANAAAADTVATTTRDLRRVRAEALPKLKGGLRALYRTLELTRSRPLARPSRAFCFAKWNSRSCEWMPKSETVASQLANLSPFPKRLKCPARIH